MRVAVSSAFAAFSEPIEGRVPYLYLDTLGYVTTGVGNKIESADEAAALPFTRGREPASPQEIRDDYEAVRARTDLAGRHLEFQAVSPLRLTDAGIDTLVAGKLDDMAHRLTQTAEFAGFEQWPADAQLALLSIAWAQGPNLHGWPGLRAACAAGDWRAAAGHSHLKDSAGGTIVHRNAADRALFHTAAYVVEHGLDPDVLWYRPMGRRAVPRPGDSGADVELLQERLRELGYLPVATGVMDAETDEALRSFQRDNDLAVDGIAGGATWAALGTAVPAASVPV